MPTEPIRSATPGAPSSATRKLYPKSDGWYDQNSAGTETKVGPQAGTKGSALTAGTTPIAGTEGVFILQSGVLARVSADAVRRVIPVEVAMLLATTTIAPAAASSAVNVEAFTTSKTTRNRVDLTNATQCRLVCMVNANGNATGAALKLSYMTTEAATWAGTDAGATVVLGTGTVNTLRDSGWQTLAAGARADNMTIAALVGVAFGTTAPTISSLSAFFR